MFKRDLSKYQEKDRRVYDNLVKEGEELFKGDSKNPSIFHQMLIDRVADAYVTSLNVDMDTKNFSEKKFKASQEKLQRWLTMTFGELHSVRKEIEKRQAFFQSCVEELTKVIVDESMRRDVFRCLKRIVEEGT